MPSPLWRELGALEGTEAFNLYGPTEATVDALAARIGDRERPRVGCPTANTRAYVLDTALRPVPPPGGDRRAVSRRCRIGSRISGPALTHRRTLRHRPLQACRKPYVPDRRPRPVDAGGSD
ncbi:AMP-binding protein [Streptomyces sp. NPDC002533]